MPMQIEDYEVIQILGWLEAANNTFGFEPTNMMLLEKMREAAFQISSKKQS